MFFANASKMQMVRPENALPGRPDPLPLTEPHFRLAWPRRCSGWAVFGGWSASFGKSRAFG